MPEHRTGNPVFDFQAAHRVSAARIQRILTLGGLLIFFGAFIVSLFVEANLSRILLGVSTLGFFAIVGGIAWGFHWRKKLQQDFRKEHGPQM